MPVGRYVLLATLAMAGSPASTDALTIGFGVNAGTTVGLTADARDATALWGTDVDFPVSPYFSVRGQFAFTNFRLRTDRGTKAADRLLGLNLRYYPGKLFQKETAGYLVGGLGEYEKHSGGILGAVEAGDSKLGFNLGGGVVMFKGHGPGGLVLEGLYHYVPDYEPGRFVTVTLGLELWLQGH